MKPKRKNKWVHLNRCKPYLGYETVDELSTFQGRPCYEEETEIRTQNKDKGKTSSQSPVVEDSHDREPQEEVTTDVPLADVSPVDVAPPGVSVPKRYPTRNRNPPRWHENYMKALCLAKREEANFV